MTTEMDRNEQQRIADLENQVRQLTDKLERIENILNAISTASDLRRPKIDRNQTTLSGWQIKGTDFPFGQD
tara:strand:+ start:239 stop:451 length:213 start_codon:yes stop_codon:yes gene_type:complete